VTGYVLDGIATASGASADQFFYSSNTDTNFGEVGDAFLVLCEKDMDCKKRFKPIGLKTSLRNLIVKFDKHPNSKCATLVNNTLGLDAPSFGLRSVLGVMLMDSNIRTLIPPVVYRLQRCSHEDVKILTHFLTNIRSTNQAKTQDSDFESPLLYSLILYSEMWESPLPSLSEMTTRFTDAKMTGGGIYGLGSTYCAFTKEKSNACAEFNVGTYDASAIAYKHDKYWNKSATIPSQASVLLLSGKLDPQTPNKYAEALLSALKGKRKELIAFDYAAHGTILTTPMVARDPWSQSCGMKVFASYVRNGGNLKRLDKSCVERMPTFSLAVPDGYLASFFGTDDSYNGVFNSSLIPN
ncbi:Serine protease, partial [Phytophthora megakarya]